MGAEGVGLPLTLLTTSYLLCEIMLIALIGPTSSGKLEVAKYLIVHHNFRPAFISSKYTNGKDDYGFPSSLIKQNQSSLERRWQELVNLCQDRDSLPSNQLQGPSASSSASSLSNGNKPFLFPDCQTLLDHVTFNWRDNVVTLDLTSRQDLEIGFDKRPFFLLIGIDAPVLLRWRRTVDRKQAILASSVQQDRSGNDELENKSSIISLEDFMEQDDSNLYGLDNKQSNSNSFTMNGNFNLDSLPSTPSKMPQKGTTIASMNGLSIEERMAETPPLTTPIGNSTIHQVVQPNGNLVSRIREEGNEGQKRYLQITNLRELMQSCSMIIQNNFKTLPNFHSHLSSLNLSSNQRLRPSWDTYFLSLCTLASLRSNCMKRRVGAVLVRNNRVLSTGYNGTPRGLKNCSEGGCSRCNGAAAGGTALDECLCLHAEENALLECGRERGGAEGTVLYCNTCPCLRCAVKIVQTGVREVVYQLAYSMDDRSRMIFQEANVLFRQYHPL